MSPVPDGAKVYQQGALTFIVAPKKTIVRTTLGQEFLLSPKLHYFNRRINLIRVMIALNEIRNLNELATWCKPGIEWVPTRASYEQSRDGEGVAC